MGDVQMANCRFANQFERRIQNTFSITGRVRWGAQNKALGAASETSLAGVGLRLRGSPIGPYDLKTATSMKTSLKNRLGIHLNFFAVIPIRPVT